MPRACFAIKHMLSPGVQTILIPQTDLHIWWHIDTNNAGGRFDNGDAALSSDVENKQRCCRRFDTKQVSITFCKKENFSLEGKIFRSSTLAQIFPETKKHAPNNCFGGRFGSNK